jgi:hypothetical protein
MFFTGSLENYLPIFERAAALLTEEMSWAAADKQFIGIHSLLQDMSLNVIGQAAFGRETSPPVLVFDVQENFDKRDKKSADTLPA